MGQPALDAGCGSGSPAPSPPFAPLGLVGARAEPTACAVGCILSPLRGLAARLDRTGNFGGFVVGCFGAAFDQVHGVEDRLDDGFVP